MKKMALCLLVILSITQISKAQSTRYVIKFKDKGTNPYSLSNPSAYLSSRAIARRTRYTIAIDSTDLPVTPRYIDSVQLAGTVTILNISKWLNSVTIQTTDAAALAKINGFSFVQTSSPIAANLNRNKFKSHPFLTRKQALLLIFLIMDLLLHKYTYTTESFYITSVCVAKRCR
jgi:hypothetical protein